MPLLKAGTNFSIDNIISWLFGIVFILIGVLTIWLVHIIPGMFYFIISLVYLPPINGRVQSKVSFKVPLAIKIGLGLVILWGTLAVGDLAEILGL